MEKKQDITTANGSEIPFDEEPLNPIDNSVDIGFKKGAYNKLQRDLDEEDLSTKGAQKLILNDLDRLQEEVKILKDIERQYHQVNIKFSVTSEQLKSSTSNEIFYSIVLTLGGVIMGVGPSVFEHNKFISIVLIIISVVLLLGVFITKLMSKK